MHRSLVILFVNPSGGTAQPAAQDQLKGYLTLGSLASALRDKTFLRRMAERLGIGNPAPAGPELPGHAVHVLQLASQPGDQPITRFLEAAFGVLPKAPDLVGMTATSADLEEACEVARLAARFFPSALRAIGGPHASVLPEETLRHSEYQLACFGEGVETLAELLLRWPPAEEKALARLAGIAYKDSGGNVHRNPPRRPLLPLEDYPFPSASLDLFWPHLDTPDKNGQYPVSVLAGYGCPHDCSFCAQSCIHAGNVRERNAASIFAEVERLYARGFRKFAFVQETFLNNRQRVRRFCELLSASGLEIEWTAEARADQVSRNSLAEMRSAGLKFIQLGVETGDEELLRSIGKTVSREQIVRATAWCRELGIHTAFYMLAGLPGQGWQSILRSALLVWQHTPYNLLTRHVSVAIAIPYPGTRIARDHTVRLVDRHSRSWPVRNPAVAVGEHGEFEGRAPTETDDMTAAEIFEAWLYLDDFCHFLMHARSGEGRPDQRSTSGDYAQRLLYMIQRRTVRDLILRAQPRLTPALRAAALLDLSEQDRHAERHFKDVAAETEPLSGSFLKFLATARFDNGFQCMRLLRLPNRLKWMKLCGIAWLFSGKIGNRFTFVADERAAGEKLDLHLDGLRMESIDRCLEAADRGEACAAPFLERLRDGGMQVFGIPFGIEVRAGKLTVRPLPS
jgi:radical SAM superfamily enzyme YgiQ (UPF0313 family)